MNNINIPLVLDNLNSFICMNLFYMSLLLLNNLFKNYQMRKLNKIIVNLQKENNQLIVTGQKELKTFKKLYDQKNEENKYLSSKIENDEDVEVINKELMETYQKYSKLKFRYTNLKTEYLVIKEKYIKTNKKYQQLLKDNEDLTEEYNDLLEHSDLLEEKYNHLEEYSEESDCDKKELEQQIIENGAELFDKEQKIQKLENLNGILGEEVQEKKIIILKLRKSK